ncbi:hypothetical protein CFP56_038351 [Quercus suber]|uniref:Uncharacterized protein n=1 Tax=Quercus suber TaxID=58331 RepID=A0AAW0J3U1_QUESU
MVMGGLVAVASDGRPVGSFRLVGRLLSSYSCLSISASLQQSNAIGPTITSPHPKATGNTLWVCLSKIPSGLNLLAVVDDDLQKLILLPILLIIRNESVSSG